MAESINAGGVTVPDEAVGAAQRSAIEYYEWTCRTSGVEPDPGVALVVGCAATAVLAAAAPLITAQALRAAIDYIARDTIGVSTGDPWLDEAMDQERINFGKVRRVLIERADELERGGDHVDR